MITIETLNENLKNAKLQINLFNASTLVVDSFLQREEFELSLFDGRMKTSLFSDIITTLFSCGRLTVGSKNCTHFLSMGRDVLTEDKIKAVKKLRSAMKLIEQNQDDSLNFLHQIANEKLN